MKCLEMYFGSAMKFKSRFRIHKSDIKSKKDRCGNALILPIPLYIYVCSSLRKYIASMRIVILKIFYGIEKNIGSPNYLQM